MVISKIDGFPMVEPRPDNIPEFLQRKPCATWTAESKDGQPGKFNKAPRHPVTGIKVGANNPDSFGTFEQAVAALETGKYSGIGVLLTGDDLLVGVDIDNYEATFEQMPQVKAWVGKARKAGAYCEVSPSGKGLRLFIGGKLPNGGRKSGSLEIYARGRFLTVTGKTAKGFGMTLIDGQELIDEYLAMLPEETPKAAPVMLGNAAADPAQVESLAKHMADKQASLWAGDWELVETDFGSTGYLSQSEADFAMCGYIAREALRIGVTDESLPDTVMSVFELSGLYREKKRDTVENNDIPKIVASVLADKAEAVETANQVAQTPEGEELATHEPGDILAGRTFARAMRGKLRYMGAADKWLRWDGTRWAWCSCGEEMASAKKVAGKILDHAAKLFASDPTRYKKLMAFATSLQNLKRLQAMIELAKSEDGMAVGHMSELDSDPWLLGVRNGVVNLKDGGLLAPDPAMLITRQAAAEYHDDAQCPKWLEFLNQIFNGDQDTIDYIQRALGYTLTGTTTEEALFICFGHGANGKSVFSNVVSTIMGEYARMAPASLLTVRRADDSGPRNDLAMLCGARLVSINETQSGDRLDEQIVKSLAGREMISARFLHKEFFEFWPTAKPWLRTNHKPIITGEDDGIWRRLQLISFARKFSEDERDPWLESKLLEERDGILAWMVRGCLAWRQHKLKQSASVRRESATYRKESDLLGEFLEEMAKADPEAKVEQLHLFNAYRNWHESNGTRAGSKHTFTKKLAERGYGTSKSTNRRFYTGVTLLVLGE